jgi:hypothetical protein
MMESLSQKTRLVGLSRSSRKPAKSETSSHISDKKLKIKESISWSICFAVVAAITGALLVYRVGITMSLVTSILFYFSLLGFIGFIARAIRLYRSGNEQPAEVESKHLLN